MNTRRIALRHFAQEHLDIMDPMHNVREIAKQFLLLEDHLIHPSKRCTDCIGKHLLTAEAFAEEAISLDRDQNHSEMLAGLPEAIRGFWHLIIEQKAPMENVAQSIRQLRKNLVSLL